MEGACSENSLLSKEVQEKCADSDAAVTCSLWNGVICPRIRGCGCCFVDWSWKSPHMCRSRPRAVSCTCLPRANACAPQLCMCSIEKSNAVL